MLVEKSPVFSTYNGSVLIVPPKKIVQSYYRCDNKFHLDDILEMYEEEEKYGIVLVSGDSCRIYKLTKTGTHTQIREVKTTNVHQLKSHKKGGQSAPRFQRLRDENEDAQIKKVCGHLIDTFWDQNGSKATVSGLLIAGPAELKNKVRDHHLVKQYFESVIVGVVTTPTIDDRLVFDVYDKNADLFVSDSSREGAQIIKKIKKLIERGDDRLIFGYNEAVENLELCMLERLVISNDLTREKNHEISELNTYNCKVYTVPSSQLDRLGMDMVGIKFY